MAPRSLPPTLLAFQGGVPLFAGEEPTDLTQPIDVEIGLTGQYKTRNFELTSKHFDEMIKNHQAAGVDPAVDRGHESWFSFVGNEPALGWVRALRVEQASGDARRKALVATVQLNDLGQAAVKNGHFRYVSMGFDKAGKDRMSGEPIGAVLDHLALVKNPFIQGMRPLSLALSAKLGRLVEEEPMEQLAQKLREAFGLSADATEEQIIAAFAATRGKQAADAEALKQLEQLRSDLAEQKAVNARLEQGLKALGDDAEVRKAATWKETLAAKVAEFTISPAEAAEQEKLTGAERDVAARLLALRQVGALKPAAKVVTDKAPTSRGTDAEGLTAAQFAEVEAFKKANPGADDAAALIGAMSAKPELFSTEAV